ncbi:hypothetical protein REPUB_Repub04eG0247200 [Reevesia pubescens]
MATPQPVPNKIDLRAILAESKRIINAHFRHFLALSVIFLLPRSFSFFVDPVINQLFSQSFTPTIESHLNFSFPINNDNPFSQNPPPIFPIKTLIFTLLCTLFNFIFSLLATGSIIYSVFHGFYGRPIKLISAIKSAFTSFFRLMSTFLVTVFIIYGILLILGLTLGLTLFSLLEITQVLGFQVDFISPYFTTLYVVFTIICVSIAFYLQVNWVFAYVVVVVESSWGLEPLKRSQNLVKGMKRDAFWMILFFESFLWILNSSSTVRWGYPVGDKWKILAFFINIVFNSTFRMLVRLYNLAATTVFYMYSKAIHGELAGEEFAIEYLSLPFDDGKIPHVVSVV